MRPRLFKLEDVTLRRMMAAKTVRATDGCLSRLLWENPIPGPTDELFIQVEEFTDECISPLNRRITDLLLKAEQDPEPALQASRARGSDQA